MIFSIITHVKLLFLSMICIFLILVICWLLFWICKKADETLYTYLAILLNNIPGNIALFGYKHHIAVFLNEVGFFNKFITIYVDKQPILQNNLIPIETFSQLHDTMLSGSSLTNALKYKLFKNKIDNAWNAYMINAPYYGMTVWINDVSDRALKTIYKLRKKSSIVVFKKHKNNLFISTSLLNNLIKSFKYKHVVQSGNDTVYILSNITDLSKLFESYGL